MNGRGLGPTSEVAHWRIWLAPCEFPVQQGDCESIAVVHSIESLSDHKILVRIIHLDHFDPETACSLLSIGFPSAQLKQNYTDDTFDGPMTSRFFHRLQGLGKNYYWPQDRSPRSRDISTDRFWCSFSTCVDVQTCVYIYKMRQYPTYVHTSKLMYMILNIHVTYIKPMSYVLHRFAVPGNVLPCLVQLVVAGCRPLTSTNANLIGLWTVTQPWARAQLVSVRCIQVLKTVLDTFCTGTAITTFTQGLPDANDI